MIVKVYGEQFECDKAVKGSDYVHLYEGNECIASFNGINDFDGYTIEGGEWSAPEASQADRTEAQALYTALMTDTLLEESEG